MTYDNIYFYDTLDSTNEKLKALSEGSDIPEFSVVTTSFQTAGRGQEGNAWESEQGKNMTVSILLKPEFLSPADQFYISKIVSIALRDTLEKYGINSEIKWPNDIYAGNKKIAGILIENSIMGAALSVSIAGVGLNVNQKVFLSDARNPVSMINILKKETDLGEVQSIFLQNLYMLYNALKDEKFAEIDKRYFNSLYRRNGLHRFKDSGGVFMAEITGVEPMGHLVLTDTDGEVRKYAFKEVEFVLE